MGLSANAPQIQIWSENDPDLFIIGFERLLQNIESIVNGQSSYPIQLLPNYLSKRIFIIQCALSNGGTPRKGTLYVTENNPGCSSLYKPRTLTVSREVQVDILTVDDFYEFFLGTILKILIILKLIRNFLFSKYS